MKRALILSPFFFPEPISTGKYNSYLAEQLVSDGYDVEVWCSHPLYPTWKITPSEAGMQGVEIIRGGRLNRYPANALLRRAVLEIWYLAFIVKNLIVRNKDFDVVIPIFPPSLFALAFTFFKRRGAKIFGIVHDLQGVYAEREAGLVKKLIFGMIGWVEKKAFKSCDHLAYLSEGMRITANDVYQINPAKTSVYFPFVTINEFTNTGALKELIADDEKSIVYSGALGEKQNGNGIIDLFSSVLSAEPQSIAHIFSQGPLFEQLKASHASKRLQFHNLVDEADLPELLLRSKVQLVPQIEGSSNGSLPSKLPNLLASGTGIFCITDKGSELIDILAQYPAGTAVTNWDVKTNTPLIVSMLNKPQNNNINNELLAQFTKEGLVARISKESSE